MVGTRWPDEAGADTIQVPLNPERSAYRVGALGKRKHRQGQGMVVATASNFS